MHDHSFPSVSKDEIVKLYVTRIRERERNGTEKSNIMKIDGISRFVNRVVIGKERQVKVGERETKGVGTDVPDLERTFGFRCSCNEPWPRRQKPQGRLGPK